MFSPHSFPRARRSEGSDTRIIERTDWTRVGLRLEHWSLAALGPRGSELLFQLIGELDDFIASSNLAILLRQPETRARAFHELVRRPRPQQIEVADRADWDDEWFITAMQRDPRGVQILRQRTVTSALRKQWPGRDCRLEDLLALTRRESVRQGLDPSWSVPLSAMLIDDARMLFREDLNPCRREGFTREVRAWLGQQPAEVRDRLIRRRPEFADR